MNLTLNTSMQKGNWLIISCLHIKQVLVKIARFFVMLHERVINFGSHHKAFTEKQKHYVAYSNRIIYYVALLMGSQVFLTFTYSNNVVLIITHIMFPIGLIIAQSVKWLNRFYLSTNLLLFISTAALVIFDKQYIIHMSDEGGFFLYYFLMIFVITLSSKESTYTRRKILLQYIYPAIGITLCFVNTSFLGWDDSGHSFHIGKAFFFNTMTVFSMCTFFLVLQMGMNRRLSKKVEDKQTEIIKLIETESKYAMKAVIDAEENEKQRISAELHDSVGQLLAATKANLDQVKTEIANSNQSVEAISNCIQILKLAMNEVRNISHNLMPAILQNQGLCGAIEQICRNSKLRNGNAIDFKCDNLLPQGYVADHETSLHLYRVVQECVGNILKHSHATEARIDFLAFDHQIILKIVDNGKGFREEYKGGNGLMNIKNRCAAIGAEMTIETSVLEGTTTTIVLNDLKMAEIGSMENAHEMKVV